MDNGKIGTFIRALRQEKGLTQKELADRLHITDRAVSKWERGLNAPDIALLEPLAEILGVTIPELIRGERTAPEEPRPPEGETRQLLDYSRDEIARKVGAARKKYLGLLAGALALVLLAGGALLWRSGALFLLDRKVSPDGESVIRVYSKKWDFWPLRFTLEDTVQTVGEIGPSAGGGDLYISYGYENASYEDLWWAPDSKKYVIAVRWAEGRYLELTDLERNVGRNLGAVVNLYYWMLEEGLVPQLEEPPEVEYQFLQWGKDSQSMLSYYCFETESPGEGYFWYNCETGQVSGILPLSPR